MKRTNPMLILMADDDADDRDLARDAMAASRLTSELRFVEDGEQLLDYLHRRGRFQGDGCAPQPGIIVLDLNMPKVDGREALSSIKADARLRRIPVVILTTSSAPRDIAESYDLGANSFITKPATFGGAVDLLETLGRYWFGLVVLPEPEAGSA